MVDLCRNPQYNGNDNEYSIGIQISEAHRNISILLIMCMIYDIINKVNKQN